MRDGKLFPSVCVFTGIFGVRKVQCYLSVQVIVLLETKFFGILLLKEIIKKKIREFFIAITIFTRHMNSLNYTSIIFDRNKDR